MSAPNWHDTVGNLSTFDVWRQGVAAISACDYEPTSSEADLREAVLLNVATRKLLEDYRRRYHPFAVQIHASHGGADFPPGLYALANDGRVWMVYNATEALRGGVE